jgi:hypothetical protein
MLAERKRLAYSLLVLAGVWVAHELGYLVAHPDPLLRAAALGGHAYLELARALLVPAAGIALGWLAVQESRDADLGVELRPLRLAGWQMLVFLLIEVVERLPGGHLHTVLHEPAMYVGLALMVPIAVLLVWLVGATARVLAALLVSSPPPPPLARQRSWSPVPSSKPVVTARLSSLSSRGPPSLALNH